MYWFALSRTRDTVRTVLEGKQRNKVKTYIKSKINIQQPIQQNGYNRVYFILKLNILSNNVEIRKRLTIRGNIYLNKVH